MRNYALLLLGTIFSFISCSIESFDDNQLKATNLVTNGDEAGCETGFAICVNNISTCFLDDGFNRWGWTIGPVESGVHDFGIFAGAGQCDTSKGELAGKVRLIYDTGTGVARVIFTAFEGYVFHETHLYVGNDPYPMQQKGNKAEPTVSPGQYPYKHDDLDNATKDEYIVEGLSGDIYVIAHVVVCKREAI